MKTSTNHAAAFPQRILAALAASLYFGLSAFVAVNADDSEIYITKLPEAQTPNVLFAVDTSGSMRENVPGTSQSRMEAVKEALTDLINNTGNLKAGLSRFHPLSAARSSFRSGTSTRPSTTPSRFPTRTAWLRP